MEEEDNIEAMEIRQRLENIQLKIENNKVHSRFEILDL